jgi:hypothetical protein
MIKPLTMFFYDALAVLSLYQNSSSENLNRSAGTYKSHKSDVSKEKEILVKI